MSDRLPHTKDAFEAAAHSWRRAKLAMKAASTALVRAQASDPALARRDDVQQAHRELERFSREVDSMAPALERLAPELAVESTAEAEDTAQDWSDVVIGAGVVLVLLVLLFGVFVWRDGLVAPKAAFLTGSARTILLDEARCTRSDVEACRRMLARYENGWEGVAKDLVLASERWIAVCELEKREPNCRAFRREMDRIQMDAEAVKREQTARSAEQNCEDGNRYEGCSILGERYEEGTEGFSVDKTRAADYRIRACESHQSKSECRRRYPEIYARLKLAGWPEPTSVPEKESGGQIGAGVHN